MIKFEIFMHVYMYALEQHLLTKANDISRVSFQSDEANTDRPLKEYLKNEIESSFSKIPADFKINTVNSNNEDYPVYLLKDISIKRVLLPEHITEEIKQKIKERKNSVYTNPDLCFELVSDTETCHISVELKSTKNDSIPGSSVQQIDTDEWVIFIKHSKNQIDVITGKYINAINTKMQFPDRSPRPQVSFSTLSSWNSNNRIVNVDNLSYKIEDQDILQKKELISDWQQVLTTEWLKVIFDSTSTKKNEPWFNNALRKFIIAFTAKYDSLTDIEKKELIQKISQLIAKS